MESWRQRAVLITLTRAGQLRYTIVRGCAGAILVLTAATAANPAFAAEARALELEPLLVREPERRQVNVDAIDAENWEVGVFGGLMNVEDFGTNPAMGLRLAYHVSEDVFVEAAYGRTKLGRTSFERLSGDARILTDDERDMDYYNLSVGYHVLPGEAFLGPRMAFKGALYFAAGAGVSEFGGDDRFTVNVGLGYRLICVDWLALRFDVRDHVFQSDLLGSRKTLHNIELSGGVTVFF